MGFHRNTTILVGAGASAEFGVSTGRSVFSSLLAEPTRIRDSDYNFEREAFSSAFEKYYFSAKGRYQVDEIENLVAIASNSFENSIDMFSFQNPSIQEMSKIYSLWKIMGDMTELKTRRDITWGDEFWWLDWKYSWRKPIIDGNSNWIAAFLRKYVEGCNDSSQLEPNNINFITFNYDCIIEDALQSFLKKSERFNDATEQQIPDVHHVYGSFKINPQKPADKHLPIKAPELIRYIRDEHDTDHVQTIREVIGNSDSIIMIGFACDPRNCELIGLPDFGGDIYAVNYDGNFELQNRLQELGTIKENILSGTESSPIGVNKAAEMGLFSRSEIAG